MKATEVSLNGFLSQSKTQFVIPVYQRNYDWLEVQCAQLLNDILEVGLKTNETHFIGSIVFIHDGVYSSSSVRQLVVIDGQQRLTTFSLLYLALQKFALINGMEEQANEIQDTYLINKYVKEENAKLKLKQSDNNSRAFNFIMAENAIENYSEYSRVIENYCFFYNRITKDNFITIGKGLASLLFVEISLERGKDDPQRIFESLNSTGLELSQADLIRNYILMGLEPSEQVRVFHNYWEVIEANARDAQKEESKVSEFIRDYLTFKLKKIPNKGKVYEEFKLRYPSRNLTFYQNTLSELKEFSYQYTKLLNPESESDLDIRKELGYIQRLEINITYPFLLPLFNDYKEKFITKEQLVEILKLVQSYVWRRFIVNLPTNSLNKVFMTLYSDVDRSNYVDSVEKALVRKKGSSKFPSNEDIRLALLERDAYNIQSKNRVYFLELLENHNNREFVSVDNPAITIEHIFPQNPDEKWYTDLKGDDPQDMSEKYLNSIANLTLSGNNGSLGNRAFGEKKSMNRDGKQQGYQFSRLWLNQYLSTIDEWNVSTLKARFELILQRFYEIWEFPDVEIDEELESDEDFTIYNAPDPKNRKLDYFIFRDERIVTDEVSKMYYHVIQKLYSESPSTFHNEEIKDLLGMSSNPEDLRTPFGVTPSYFMEANLDSNSKFVRLKKLLPIFGAEEDLLINFSPVRISANGSLDAQSWLKKSSPETMKAIDRSLEIIQSIDGKLSLSYNVSYIGLQKRGQANNFILFFPKPTFIRVGVKVADPAGWLAELKTQGLHFVSISTKNGRLKFRVDARTIDKYTDFLSRIFTAAYEQWSK